MAAGTPEAGHRSGPGRRIAAALAVGLLLGAALWQLRPLLVWHLTLAPEIERSGRAARIRVPTLRQLPRPAAHWTLLRAGGLSLRAPLLPGQQEECRRCAGTCVLALESGRLTFFENAPPGSWETARTRFAPAPGDLSPWRSNRSNWRTLEALAARAVLPTAPPEAFRFETASSLGLVSRFESHGKVRFVVYSYRRDGRPARLLALSRSGEEVLHRVLGGLAADDTVAAGCNGGDGR